MAQHINGLRLAHLVVDEDHEPVLPPIEGLLADAERSDDLGHRRARLSLPQSEGECFLALSDGPQVIEIHRL